MKPIHFAQAVATLICGFTLGFANAQTRTTSDQTTSGVEVTSQKAQALKDCKGRAQKLQLKKDDEEQFIILCVQSAANAAQTATTSDQTTSDPTTAEFEFTSQKAEALKDCTARGKKLELKNEDQEQFITICMQSAANAANKMKELRVDSVKRSCEEQAEKKRLEHYQRINFVNSCVELADESYKKRRANQDKEKAKSGGKDKNDITFTGVAGDVKLECSASEGLSQTSCDALAVSVKQLNEVITSCLAAGEQKQLKRIAFNLYVNSCAEAVQIRELAKIRVIACNAAADLQSLEEDNSANSRSTFIRHCNQPKKKQPASEESDGEK